MCRFRLPVLVSFATGLHRGDDSIYKVPTVPTARCAASVIDLADGLTSWSDGASRPARRDSRASRACERAIPSSRVSFFMFDHFLPLRPPGGSRIVSGKYVVAKRRHRHPASCPAARLPLLFLRRRAQAARYMFEAAQVTPLGSLPAS